MKHTRPHGTNDDEKLGLAAAARNWTLYGWLNGNGGWWWIKLMMKE